MEKPTGEMRLKGNNVSVTGMRPELLFGLVVADRIWATYGHELVISSENDGKHSITSLHYSGCAADLRTSYFDDKTIRIVAEELKESLKIDFDVLIERDHIHLEWQPRRR